MTEMLNSLVSAIGDVCSDQQNDWLREALTKLENSKALAPDLGRCSTQARRQLGRQPLGAGYSPLISSVGPVAIDHWESGDAGRIAMILLCLQREPEQAETLVTSLFRQGDESERAAIVRGLALFPSADRLKSLALEAGRANSLVLVSSIALLNPYPAAYYSDREFNQMVLKALFVRLNADLIYGLGQRVNSELSRMCEDYVDELLAADRDVPPEIWMALLPYASVKGVEFVRRYLDDPNPLHRYYSAKAMVQSLKRFPELRAALDQRFSLETDEHVREILGAAAGG
ncbi:EboA domain-containing protein [Methylocaldum sp. GT1TLB]|uniref:EboA domain-containing protein n=1 Tax=Methylocaldum sp. GT1TLB TaxID=3438965 RepID=UPI003DA01517